MSRRILFLLLPLIWIPASAAFAQVEVQVRNPIDLPRHAETIEIDWQELLRVDKTLVPDRIRIRRTDTPAEAGKDESARDILHQLLVREDGRPPLLLFQTDLLPGETQSFAITPRAAGEPAPASPRTTYCRHVPERSGDFAFENDCVAFRMYGPGLRDGAENCGVDCWLKRVAHPVIDKWYRENAEGKSYHVDHGEGHDPYHVGSSLGCGGSAVWWKDRLCKPNVFMTWRVLANGPIRSIFELTYGPFDVGDREVTETRRGTLDLGRNLVRFDCRYRVNGKAEPLQVAVGLTTHDQAASRANSLKHGWFACWEELSGGLGTGVVFEHPKFQFILDMQHDEPDRSHLVMVLYTDAQGEMTYHAGFGWTPAMKGSGPGKPGDEDEQDAPARPQFNAEQWHAYLTAYSARIRNPVEIKIRPIQENP